MSGCLILIMSLYFLNPGSTSSSFFLLCAGVSPSSGSAAAARPFEVERPLEDERPPPPDPGTSSEPAFTPGMDIIDGHGPELTLKVLTLELVGGAGMDAPFGGGGGTYEACFLLLT